VIAGPTGDGRPAGAAADDEAVRQRRREALSHPAINATLEILGGEVIEIRSLGESGSPAGTTR
jgi:hypothetical protein